MGALWESRFKSVLVEDGYALRMVAAYLDLNPVRAGMVKRPEDYRWSSYGEAMSLKASKIRELSRTGICKVLGKMEERSGGIEKTFAWEDGAAESYRMMLFSDGEEVFVHCSESLESPESGESGFC